MHRFCASQPNRQTSNGKRQLELIMHYVCVAGIQTAQHPLITEAGMKITVLDLVWWLVPSCTRGLYLGHSVGYGGRCGFEQENAWQEKCQMKNVDRWVKGSWLTGKGILYRSARCFLTLCTVHYIASDISLCNLLILMDYWFIHLKSVCVCVCTVFL